MFAKKAYSNMDFDITELPYNVNIINAKLSFNQSWEGYGYYVKISTEEGLLTNTIASNLYNNPIWSDYLENNPNSLNQNIIIPIEQVLNNETVQLNILIYEDGSYIDNSGSNAPRITIEYEMEMQECSDLELLECNNNDNCNWVQNIEIEYCDGESEEDCLTQDGCSWDLTYGGYLSFDWYYSCNGYYEIDNSNCQEIEMFECSEMSQAECSSINGCEWVENMEWVSCNDINSQLECNAVGCSWYNGNYYACTICCWGEYEHQLGDINQDYIINIQDIIIVINLILNGEFILIADLNQDQSINVIDILLIIDKKIIRNINFRDKKSKFNLLSRI
tara:strand:+ start:1051 stop:2052 length:1002 start_codon:yes stop_codon:yes gene_type:complete